MSPQGPVQRKLVRLAGAMNQKAERLGRPGRVTADDLGNLLLQGTICFYDQVEVEPLTASFDHRVPFDQGGDNVIENIVVCCITCNRRKFTKSAEEYEIYQNLVVHCVVCGREFKPRWNDYKRGFGRTCSRRCASIKSHNR